jgi:serine protease AprX
MGFTWNFAAPAPTNRRFRGAGTTGVVALMSTTLIVAGTGVALQRSLSAGAPVGVGSSPWFGLPDGLTSLLPLPDLASVEQVVNVGPAWLAGANGRGIDVAVLDSGVTPVAGLDAPNKVVYGPDLSFDSQDPSRIYLDGYGHGTAMASIIAGDDGTPTGFRGIAPGARVVSVKVGASNGALDVSQVIAGIDWVVEHAHDPGYNIRVLSIALGTDSTQSWLVDPLAHAAEVAWRNGIVVVAAVGNTGTASRAVADPAIDPYIIGVGASDPVGTLTTLDDVPAPFTARGTGERRADLVAPGVSIVGLRTPGSLLDQQYPNARIGDRFFRGSGTSQATAIVAGAAADLLSARPSLTPNAVKRLMRKSAVSISGSPNDVGAGLLNVNAALGASVGADANQSYGVAAGTGALELARASSHVSLDGVMLTGERDIFGNRWDAPRIAAAEEAGVAWDDGTYNGATWSGATWSGATWSGATWSGATWSGATWSGATWSGATWSGATWSGATWSGATWSGATWSGSIWSAGDWR